MVTTPTDSYWPIAEVDFHPRLLEGQNGSCDKHANHQRVLASVGGHIVNKNNWLQQLKNSHMPCEIRVLGSGRDTLNEWKYASHRLAVLAGRASKHSYPEERHPADSA
jgi:hypothetical protein